MRDSRRKACMLLLASAGLLPSQAPAALAGGTRLEVVRSALSEARRRLELERFLLRKLESIGDAGISPSYPSEVEAAKGRIFEARALVLALERLERELAPPITPPPAPSALPAAPDARPGTPSRPAPPSPPGAASGSPATARGSPAPPAPDDPS